MRNRKKAFAAYGGALLVAGLPVAVFAQQSAAPAPAPAPADDAAGQPATGGLTDIVVTARKSKESILKSPVSVSALTSKDIQDRGIVSMSDIAEFTPSMKVGNIGAGRNDRSFQQIVIRGFTPPTVVAQTTSIFVDGVPVSSATALNNVTDPERVEILKGPQSAYFGRQTFAGAVNIVTKAPTQTLTGTVDAMAGSRSNYDVMGEISGPLIPDILSIRVTGRAYGKDGSYKNAGDPTQTLGNQKTKTGTVAMSFTPNERLTVKLFGMLTADDDGPAAQGFLSAYTVKDAAGRTVVQGQANCVVGGNPQFCGVTPGLINSPAVNTINDTFIKNALANPNGRLLSPSQGVQGYGLKDRSVHLHMVSDYVLGDTGVTFSSLTGYNHQRMSELTDITGYASTDIPNNAFGTIPGARSYFDFPYLDEQRISDWSQELRASYAGHGIKATVGASYLDARRQEGDGGGNGALATTDWSTVEGETRAKTFGVFFGLGYQVTSKLTINFDGRYQIDHIFAYTPPGGLDFTSDALAPAGYYAGNTVLAQKTYKNFLPRAIAQYDITPDNMVYASYSQGVNPAAFNTLILTNTPAVQAAVAALGYKIAVDPEKLDNYEIGFKGKLLNNKVQYTLAVYRAIWKNQINFASIPIFDPSTNTEDNIQASINAGRVRMTGVEAEVRAAITQRWSLDVNGSINNSSIEQLLAPSTTTQTGITNFTGKQNPLVPKYNASGGLEYTAPVGNNLNVFARGDLSFKSGVYADASNLLRTPNLVLTNFRVGVSNHRTSVEAFVTNAFNTHAPTTAQGWPLFTPNFQYAGYNSGVTLGLPDLRTFGFRVRQSF